MKFTTLFTLILTGVLFSSLQAATHTISFGGSVGFAYDPSSLQVNVGDVIVWQGDFSFHPLASNNIPSGAAPFSNNSGSTFQYTVTEAGTYGYHCTAHGSPGSGMFGTFTATAASVKHTLLADAELLQNYPNPSNAATNISFRLTKSSSIALKVYRIDGSEVATPVSGKWSEGLYTIPFETAPLEAGIYFYRLIINGEAVTREMIVTK